MTVEYLRATTTEEALDALQRYGDEAKVLAGGTALALLLQEGFVAPRCLVEIGRIASLQGIREDDGHLEIGAATTLLDVESSPLVDGRLPVVTGMLRRVATVRIRSVATLGGNLSHGDPRLDPAALLLALDATVRIAGPSGEREAGLEELFVDELTTSLGDDELLTAVRVPVPSPGSRQTYRKLVGQTVDDYGIVNVAARLALDEDGRVGDARLVLGAVAATPIRVREAEDALRGERPAGPVVAEAASLAQAAADPVDDLRGSAAFKRDLVGIEVRRALEGLAADGVSDRHAR